VTSDPAGMLIMFELHGRGLDAVREREKYQLWFRNYKRLEVWKNEYGRPIGD
jgi:hypothetical protein